MRAHILPALFAALVGGLLLFSPPLRAADPNPLSCPNGQTVFLEGQSPPREALLVYLRGRAVGGGLSGADGRFSLPLRAQERPGVYPVEVRLRSNRAVVATYTCFVDVSLDTALTPTATLGGTAPVATPRGAPTAVTAAPTRAPAVTATITATRPGSAATTQPTAGTTTTATSTTATSTTATSTTATVTATSTSTSTTALNVEISDIVLRDPTFPNESEEYVQIRNASDTPVNLNGWRLINVTRSGQIPPYVFPNFTLGVDVTVAVFSAIGDDDLDIGDFYWDQPNDIWRVGDRAELRDAQNKLVATLNVPDQ